MKCLLRRRHQNISINLWIVEKCLKIWGVNSNSNELWNSMPPLVCMSFWAHFVQELFLQSTTCVRKTILWWKLRRGFVQPQTSHVASYWIDKIVGQVLTTNHVTFFAIQTYCRNITCVFLCGVYQNNWDIMLSSYYLWGSLCMGNGSPPPPFSQCLEQTLDNKIL